MVNTSPTREFSTCRPSIRLAPETEERLNFLASQTGRTKAYYLREIIEQGLEDLEDYYLAADVLERVRKGHERIHTAEEVRNELGLEGWVHLPTKAQLKSSTRARRVALPTSWISVSRPPTPARRPGLDRAAGASGALPRRAPWRRQRATGCPRSDPGGEGFQTGQGLPVLSRVARPQLIGKRSTQVAVPATSPMATGRIGAWGAKPENSPGGIPEASVARASTDGLQ